MFVYLPFRLVLESKGILSARKGTVPVLRLIRPRYKNAYSPYCSPYISYGTSKENLSKYQDILFSLVITSFIIMTSMCEHVVIT